MNDWKQIDEYMQRGYSYMIDGESIAACKEWEKVWASVTSIMDANGYKYISEFDDRFNDTHAIYNWAPDYEMVLGNATVEDTINARTRLDFCTEYLNRVQDRNELNALNMRRAIGESYFRLGMADEGEKEFKNITDENPTWGWGWIGWSDEYSFYQDKENKNYDKAIELLKHALEIDGIDEEFEIKVRLKEIYESCGRLEEADSIVPEDALGAPLSELNNIARNAKSVLSEIANEILNIPVRKIKIGRNDLCPCGSGQKYKRCCGK